MTDSLTNFRGDELQLIEFYFFTPIYYFSWIFRSSLICTSSSSEEEEEAPAKPAAKDDGVRRLLNLNHLSAYETPTSFLQFFPVFFYLINKPKLSTKSILSH